MVSVSHVKDNHDEQEVGVNVTYGLRRGAGGSAAPGYDLGTGLRGEVEMSVGYRFFGTTDADFDGAKAKVVTHNIEAGITLRF